MSRKGRSQITVSFSLLLCCPFCGGDLDCIGTDQTLDELDYGILACPCDRYPVVAGIPIFKKGVVGSTGQESRDVIRLIEDGRYREALLAVLLPPPPARALRAPPSVQAVRKWQEKAEALFTSPSDETTACEVLDFYFRRSSGVGSVLEAKDDYSYFVFRFSAPRHLTALSLASLIYQPRKPVLDLACGFGHVTRHLLQRAKEQLVIGLDRNFFYLYVAKNWLASEARYVCAEADTSLPFRGHSFSAALCSDAFPVFPNKLTCIRELERVTADEGLILLVGLRNRLVDEHLYHDALSPEAYEGLVGNVPHRVVAGSEVLARYLQKKGPVLAGETEVADLANEPWLAVVASHQKDVFREHGSFPEWPHAEGSLRLNPLYIPDGKPEEGRLHLRRVFPSAWYRQENAENRFKEFLPATVVLSEQGVLDLAQGNRTPEVEELIDQCVVLGLPDRYISTNFSHAGDDVFRTIEPLNGTFYIDEIRISDIVAVLILPGDAFILVDNNNWGISDIAGRRAIPFLEREGQYWGQPPDDETAIREMERLRRSGASFIVFGSPAMWWLEYYTGFSSYLYSTFRCVLQHEHLVVFDLRL